MPFGIALMGFSALVAYGGDVVLARAARASGSFARPISDSDPSQNPVRHLLVVNMHYLAIFDEK